MPPRKVWLDLSGTVYEIAVYDVIAPRDAIDALPFREGPGYITVRPVVYLVDPQRPRDPVGSAVALRPAPAPSL